jgi:hypothetical protein
MREGHRDIKALMRSTATRINRNVGWFFIVWGVIWTAGFVTTQIIGNDVRFVWPILNLLGFVFSFYLLKRSLASAASR